MQQSHARDYISTIRRNEVLYMLLHGGTLETFAEWKKLATKTTACNCIQRNCPEGQSHRDGKSLSGYQAGGRGMRGTLKGTSPFFRWWKCSKINCGWTVRFESARFRVSCVWYMNFTSTKPLLLQSTHKTKKCFAQIIFLRFEQV